MDPTCISFVILTWNSQDYIDRCIRSILSDIRGTGFRAEIFIVDNGSTDDTKNRITALQRTHSNIIFPIWLDKNYGTTVSRNMALKRATGDYIAILDSDVEILPGLLDSLILTLTQDRSIGLVTPKLIYPSGQLQKSTDQFPTVLRKIVRYLFLRRMEQKEALIPEGNKPRSVDYGISAVWLFKKKLLSEVGFLDEKIFYAPEDVDYCLRIWKAGQQVVYAPRAVAIHHTQEISRGFRLNTATFHHLMGLGYLFAKHRFFLKKPRFETI